MKAKIFIAICFLFSVSISAQTYFPFIESGKTWADISIFDNTVSPVEISTYGYKFGEDTLIQGKIYHSLFSCHKDSTMTNWIQDYFYGYREDSGKVYKVDWWFLFNEVELYNFNLVQGDSVLIDTFYGYAHVSYVDSTMICGSYRKTIHFEYPPDIWIEGIGSLYNTFDPLNYYFLTDGSTQLLCANDSVCQLYQNPSYSGCYIDTIFLAQNEKILIKPKIVISPNPIYEKCNVRIEGTTEQSFTLKLLNNEGKIVYNETRNTNSFDFDRKCLPSGLYFLIVIGNNLILSKKIIIN